MVGGVAEGTLEGTDMGGAKGVAGDAVIGGATVMGGVKGTVVGGAAGVG